MSAIVISKSPPFDNPTSGVTFNEFIKGGYRGSKSQVDLVAAPPRSPLWDLAGEDPSLDLRFAELRSLRDAVTGKQLVDFSRVGGGTRVNEQGIIETVYENLIPWSQEFSNSVWAKNSSVLTADTLTAPDGTITADTLTAGVDTADTWHGVYTPIYTFVSGTTYTMSVHVKAGTSEGFMFVVPSGIFGSGAARFDLTTGTLLAVSGGVTGNVEDVGGGWYRLSATATALANGAGQYQLREGPDGDTFFYTSDGSGFIYIWGAHLNRGSSPFPYYATTTERFYGERFDHNPATGESLGLLVEEQRTNSIRNNTMVGAVAGTPGTLPTNWTGNTTANGITREVVGTGAENGISYIDLRYSGTPTSSFNIFAAFEPGNQVVAANGQTWTASAYIRLAAGSTSGLSNLSLIVAGRDSSGAGIAGQFRQAPIVPTSAVIVSQRAFSTFLFTSASVAFIRSQVSFDVTNGLAIDITLRIGMPQLEQGDFATSVIPTAGTAVTRAADVCSLSGSNYSSWANANEGSLFAEFSPRTNTVFGVAYQSNGTVNEAVRLFYNNAISNYTFSVRTGGQEQSSVNNLGAYASQSERIVSAYALNNLAAVRNGGAVSTDTSAQLPVGMDRLELGTTQSANYLNGHIRRLVYWGQRLPNNVLQAITQ